MSIAVTLCECARPLCVGTDGGLMTNSPCSLTSLPPMLAMSGIDLALRSFFGAELSGGAVVVGRCVANTFGGKRVCMLIRERRLVRGGDWETSLDVFDWMIRSSTSAATSAEEAAGADNSRWLATHELTMTARQTKRSKLTQHGTFACHAGSQRR